MFYVFMASVAVIAIWFLLFSKLLLFSYWFLLLCSLLLFITNILFLFHDLLGGLVTHQAYASAYMWSDVGTSVHKKQPIELDVLRKGIDLVKRDIICINLQKFSAFYIINSKLL